MPILLPLLSCPPCRCRWIGSDYCCGSAFSQASAHRHAKTGLELSARVAQLGSPKIQAPAISSDDVLGPSLPCRREWPILHQFGQPGDGSALVRESQS